MNEQNQFNNQNQPLNNYNNGFTNGQNINMNNQNMNMNTQMQTNNEDNIPSRTNMNSYNYQVPNNNQDDDIDDYFSVPKKKFPGVLIFIIFILLLGGLSAYYYFILDDPQKIFSLAVENTLTKLESSIKEQTESNTELSLEPKIITNNEEYKIIGDIINKLSIETAVSVDKDEDLGYANINTTYDEKELLNFSYLIELSDEGNMYLELNDILDKVIKIKPESVTTEDTEEIEITIDDIKTLINEVKLALTKTLEISEFKKEYVDLDGEKVKKITLILDEKNVEYFYQQLLDSKDFIDIYTKLGGNKEDLEEEMEEVVEIYEEGIEEISLYLSILKNEFILLEDITEDETFRITKEDNKYSFELYTPSKVEFQGYIDISTLEDKQNIIINFESLEDEVSIELDILYKSDPSVEVNKLDTSNAIDIESLTDEDYNKIINGISEKEGILNLLEDLGLTDTNNPNL